MYYIGKRYDVDFIETSDRTEINVRPPSRAEAGRSEMNRTVRSVKGIYGESQDLAS
jgi:hypothetical protein